MIPNDGDNYVRRNFVVCIFTKYYKGHQIKEEIDWSCNTRGKMRNAHEILDRNLKGRDHLGDLGVSGRII
jgi:hypothetical protein